VSAVRFRPQAPLKAAQTCGFLIAQKQRRKGRFFLLKGNPAVRFLISAVAKNQTQFLQMSIFVLLRCSHFRECFFGRRILRYIFDRWPFPVIRNPQRKRPA
jgi:hypothetical protein